MRNNETCYLIASFVAHLLSSFIPTGTSFLILDAHHHPSPSPETSQATNLLAVVESDHRLSFLKGLRFDAVSTAAAAIRLLLLLRYYSTKKSIRYWRYAAHFI